MLRRPGNAPTVSFFAFQDIITGVAGVMLVLVLALTGEAWLAARDAKHPLPVETSAADRRRALLAAEESRLRGEVARLEAALRNAGARRSRLETLAALRRAEEVLRSRSAELRRNLAEPAVAPEPLPPPSPAELEYRRLLAATDALAAQYRERSLRPEVPSEHHGRKVIALECDARLWHLTMPGEAARELGAGEDLPLPAARRELFAQLDRIDAGKHCLAVLVRPAAGAYVTMLLNALEERFPTLELTAEPLPEAPDDGTDKII